MSEVLELGDGLKFFVDGNKSKTGRVPDRDGDNGRELSRLREELAKDTTELDTDIHNLPETQTTTLSQIKNSKRALLDLLENPDKLWDTELLSQFRETGRYEQISLSDAGEITLTVILPGAAVTIKKEQVDPQFVGPIRDFITQYDLDWDSYGEGYEDDDSRESGVYKFVRVIPLLRQRKDGYNINLIWHGQRTKPLIEGVPLTNKDDIEIKVKPVEFLESE